MYLFNLKTFKVSKLLSVRIPPKYSGFNRIDLHPRFSNNGEYLIERITEGGKGFAVMARGKWANKEYRKFQYSIYRGNVSEKFKEEIQGKEQGIFNAPSPEKEVGKGDPNVPGGK